MQGEEKEMQGRVVEDVDDGDLVAGGRRRLKTKAAEAGDNVVGFRSR